MHESPEALRDKPEGQKVVLPVVACEVKDVLHDVVRQAASVQHHMLLTHLLLLTVSHLYSVIKIAVLMEEGSNWCYEETNKKETLPCGSINYRERKSHSSDAVTNLFVKVAPQKEERHSHQHLVVVADAHLLVGLEQPGVEGVLKMLVAQPMPAQLSSYFMVIISCTLQPCVYLITILTILWPSKFNG